MKLFEDSSKSEEEIESFKVFLEQIKKYLALILMVSIPFNSIGSFFVYKNKKFNFAEHLVINSFTYGFTILLGLPLVALFLIPNGIFIHSTVSTPVYFIGMIYIFTKFFKENVIISFFKVLLVFLVSLIFSMLFGGLLSIIAIFIYKFF